MSTGTLAYKSNRNHYGRKQWFGVKGKPGHVYVWVQYVKEVVKYKDPKSGEWKEAARKGEGTWKKDGSGTFHKDQGKDSAAGTAVMVDQPGINMSPAAVPTDSRTSGAIVKKVKRDASIGVDTKEVKIETKFETHLVDLTDKKVLGMYESSYQLHADRGRSSVTVDKPAPTWKPTPSK